MEDHLTTSDVHSDAASSFAESHDETNLRYSPLKDAAGNATSSEHSQSFQAHQVYGTTETSPSDPQGQTPQELPLLAIPLQASALLGGLKLPSQSSPSNDWDQAREFTVPSNPSDTTQFAAPTPFEPTRLTPDQIDFEQLPTAPFPVPALPVVSFPASLLGASAPGNSSAPMSMTQPGEAFDVGVAEFETELPPVLSSWDNPASSVPSFSSPQFQEIPPAPHFAPQDSNAPLGEHPIASSGFTTTEFAPADSVERANTHFEAFTESPGTLPASPAIPSSLAAHLNLSGRPLPTPEAFVIRQAEEPKKLPRFGRKKAAKVDLDDANSVNTESGEAVSFTSELKEEKKTKRFGKKNREPVDLLVLAGAQPKTPSLLPTALADSGKSQLETPTVPSPASLLNPSILNPSLASDTPEETKEKKKLFAKVDRSKESPLTPTTGRGRKVVQALAACAFFAGAGLFAVQLFDKKSTPLAPTTTPTPPPVDISIPVETSIATDSVPLPTTAAAINGTQTNDPVTQLPAASTPGDTSASIASKPATTETTIAVDISTPAADTPVETIAPGPDDLEFSTGGDFAVTQP